MAVYSRSDLGRRGQVGQTDRARTEEEEIEEEIIHRVPDMPGLEPMQDDSSECKSMFSELICF